MFSNILLNKKNNLLMAFAILIIFALGPIRSHSEILSVGKEEIDIIHNIIKASKNNDWLHLTKITKNSNSQHFRWMPTFSISVFENSFVGLFHHCFASQSM